MALILSCIFAQHLRRKGRGLCRSVEVDVWRSYPLFHGKQKHEIITSTTGRTGQTGRQSTLTDPRVRELCQQAPMQSIAKLFNGWVGCVENNWFFVIRDLTLGLQIKERFQSQFKAGVPEPVIDFAIHSAIPLCTLEACYNGPKSPP